MVMFFHVTFSVRKRKTVPDDQELFWHSPLGLGVLLLNVNHFDKASI